MNTHTREERPARRRARVATLALGLAVAVLSGCEDLLDVELPAQLTDEALADPKGAQMLVNTFIAHFESAYDYHVYDMLGREDAGEVYLCGPMCGVAQYQTSSNTFTPMAKSLRFARELYEHLDKDWDVSEVPLRARFMALASLYQGAVLGWMGSTLCEVSINGGKLQSPAETLTQAEAMLTRAITEIGAAGDFPVQNGIATTGSGATAGGARPMAYGLRAQVRWMKGDLAGARSDAEQVPQGFVAWVTREAGLTSTNGNDITRQNRGWYSGTGGGFFEVYDPIDWWKSTVPNPVTGRVWPAVLPFTGITNLGILPDGRAVGEDGIPVRTAVGPAPWNNRIGVAAGAVADTRVRHINAQIQGKQAIGPVPAKHNGEASDHALVNWKEMMLIRAEAVGGQGAIDLVNQLRAAEMPPLPRVTYASPTNATQIKYMIIEERRRALFNEGRFFYTKLRNLDLLWFPRDVGGTRAKSHSLRGGMRFTMPNAEFINNTNLNTGLMASGCAASEGKPINPF
jgi:hypothetical protein